MPKIQLTLPEELDIKIKHFMIDNKIIDKRVAIIQILKKRFGVTIR